MNQNKSNPELNYLRSELKKGLKLIPSFGLSVLLAGAAVIIAAVLFCAFSEEHQLFPKATVAIVMEKPDFKTTAAVKLVESMDSVNTVCRFTFPTREEAEQQLSDGSIAGIIYLGADAYQDINTGVNTPIEIRLSSKAPALGRDAFSSLVRAGVSLIRTTEAAVYAGGSLSGFEEGNKITEDDVFEVYLKHILNRTSLFSTETASPLGNLSLRQFYLGSALLLILLVFGTAFTCFYTEEEETVLSLMARDVPSAALDAVRIFTQFVILFLVGALFSAVLLMVPAISPEFQELALPQRLLMWAGTLPALALCLLSIAAFWHFLYLILPAEGAGLAGLLIIILLFAFSGGLVPEVYMPAICRKLMVFSPVHMWQKCLLAAFYGEAGPSVAMPVLLFTLLTLALAFPLRAASLRRPERGLV